MLMTTLANVDFRAIKTGEKQNVIDLLNEIAVEILEGPFAQYFNSLYLLEQDGELSPETMGEVYDEFHGTEDCMKYTFFDSCSKKLSGNVVSAVDLASLGFKQIDSAAVE